MKDPKQFDTPEIQQALEDVRTYQGLFWDALLVLESLTGLELSGDVDYSDYDATELLLCQERASQYVETCERCGNEDITPGCSGCDPNYSEVQQ